MCLCFKTSLRAKHFLWKWVFQNNDSNVDSFWNRGKCNITGPCYSPFPGWDACCRSSFYQISLTHRPYSFILLGTKGSPHFWPQSPPGGEGRNWPECEGVWLPFSSLGPPDHSDHSIPAWKLICTVLPLFRSWQFLFFLANLKNLPDVESRPWSSNQRVNKLQRTHLPLVWYFIANRVSLFTMTLPNLLITFQSFLACRWNHKQTNEST